MKIFLILLFLNILCSGFIIHNLTTIPLLVSYSTINANYTVTDKDYTLNVVANSNITITLPDATTFPENRCLTIKNSGTGTTTLSAHTGQNIDGSATQSIQSKGGPLRGFSILVIQNVNPNWIIISASLP